MVYTLSMPHILYKLTFPNGKIYIGQTVRKMQTRFSQHRKSAAGGSLLPVHCAWRKHGDPSVEIMAEYGSHQELHAAEIAAIRTLNARVPNGYNLSYGGETAPSKAPEVRAKIGLKSRGRKQNPEVKSAAAKKMWESEEYRANNIAASLASWSDERRKAASDRAKAFWAARKDSGWSMPEETRAKLGQKTVSPEARANMSVAAKARKRTPRSEETKAHIRAATKAAWQNEEITERRLAAIRAAKSMAGRSRVTER
mgnify:CR=1 FL=1